MREEKIHKQCLLALTSFLILLVFNVIFPPQSDDIAHYFAATDQTRSFLHSYFNWNGRIGEILYSGFFASMINGFLLDILQAIIGTLFLFSFFFFLFSFFFFLFSFF